MKISSLLHSDHILYDLEAGSKSSLIPKLVEPLRDDLGSECSEKVLKAVLEREEVMSTGVGKGLAIPHAKLEAVEENIAVFARLKKPVEYGSIDGKPVEIVFLLVGPHDKASIHIKMLSRISRMMNNDQFRNQLLQASSAEEIKQLFEEEENLPA